MKYKGYTATIEWAEEEDAFHGRVANITDVVNFYGRSVDELRREMATSVEIYLKFCTGTGKEPDKPQS